MTVISSCYIIIPSLCRCLSGAQLIKLRKAKRLLASCLLSKLKCTSVQQRLFSRMKRKRQISPALIRNNNNQWTLLDRMNCSTALHGKLFLKFLNTLNPQHIYTYSVFVICFVLLVGIHLDGVCRWLPLSQGSIESQFIIGGDFSNGLVVVLVVSINNKPNKDGILTDVHSLRSR